MTVRRDGKKTAPLFPVRRDADDSEGLAYSRSGAGAAAEASRSTTRYRPISSPPKSEDGTTATARVAAGLDSSDARRNSNGNNNNNGGWWGSSLFAPGSKSNTIGHSANRKRRSGKARYNGLEQEVFVMSSYDPPPLDPEASVASTTTETVVDNETITDETSAEDRVRRDCSYFYRGMNTEATHSGKTTDTSPLHKTKTHRGSGRTTTAANSLLRRMAVRARLSGRVDGALFMSHGADPSSIYREHVPCPTNNVVMDATRLANPQRVRSSMFFEQDGRMLMRLPRDQVRLVMDYNLEPGIISVEQWRNRDEAEATASRTMAMRTTPNGHGGGGVHGSYAHSHAQQQQRMARIQWERERKREWRRRRKEKDRERQRRRRERRKQKKEERKQRKHKQKQKQEAPNATVNATGEDGKIVDEDESRVATTPDGKHEASEDRSSNHGAGASRDDLHRDSEDSSDFDSSSNSSSSDDDDDDTYLDYDYDLEAAQRTETERLPELKYVITVPDDLYRRMVGEMSAKAFPPYWGFFKCCNQESEPADIKLALVIMAVVMLLLFIGSLEWRTT
eukprot:jgi/Psemu1/283703/fgenesh1_pg.32_\